MTSDPVAHLRTFGAIVDHWARERPESPAFSFLRDGEEVTDTVTFRELRARCRATELAVRSSVHHDGERVLVACSDSLAFVMATLACWRAGAVVVPAFLPMLPRDIGHIRSILRESGVSLVIMDSVLEGPFRAKDLGAGLPFLLVDQVEPVPSTVPDDDDRSDPDAVALLVYTSGSTADPSGVIHTQRTMMSCMRNMLGAIGYEYGPERETWLAWTPLYHVMGIIAFCACLYVGDHEVLLPTLACVQKPIRWPRALSRFRAAYTAGSSSSLVMVSRYTTPAQREGLDLSAVRYLLLGAEPVSPAAIGLFARTFAAAGLRPNVFGDGYGLTEAPVIAVTPLVRDAVTLEHLDAAALEQGRIVEVAEPGALPTRTVVSCGRCIPNSEVVIVDPDTGEPSPPDQVGEIWFRTSDMALGYFEDLERTKQVFRNRLEGSPHDYLATGDLGFVSDGELYVTGRLKDLVISFGHNHYPQDIEASVLGAHPLLGPACAAFNAADGDERLIVVAEAAPAVVEHQEAVLKSARKAVALNHQLQANEIVLVPPGTLVRTPSGKISRSACRKSWKKELFSPLATWTRRGGE